MAAPTTWSSFRPPAQKVAHWDICEILPDTILCYSNTAQFNYQNHQSFFSRRRWPNVHVTVYDFKLQTMFFLPEKLLSCSSDFGSIMKFIYTVHMQLRKLSHFWKPTSTVIHFFSSTRPPWWEHWLLSLSFCWNTEIQCTGFMVAWGYWQSFSTPSFIFVQEWLTF